MRCLLRLHYHFGAMQTGYQTAPGDPPGHRRGGAPLESAGGAGGRRVHRPGLGIATVYRTLKALVEEGALTQVELPGEPPRYETHGKRHHHHFHCRACDRVYELEGCPEGLRSLTPAGFSLESHEVVLYGRCAACSA